LYDDLDVRPRLARGSVLPSYAPTGTRSLEPTYEDVDMVRLLEEAALAGGLGGTVGLGAGRAALTYPEWGGSVRAGLAAPWEMSEEEFVREYEDLRRTVAAAEKTPGRRMGAGEVEQMHDDWKGYSGRRGYSEKEIADFERYMQLSTDRFPDEYPSTAAIHREHVAAAKAGPLGPIPPPPEWADPEVMSRDLRAKLFPPPDAPGLLITNDPEVLRNRFTNEAFVLGANEAPRPGRLARMGAGAGRFAKAALSPVSIAMDLLLGSAVGAGSAGLGYASAAPGAGGLFTPPGPGYEGVVTSEGMERVAEAKELRNQAIRQQYIDEVNQRYGAGTLGPTARMDEIRDYLGPVR